MAWWALSAARMWKHSQVSWQCPRVCGHKPPSVGLVQGCFHSSTVFSPFPHIFPCCCSLLRRVQHLMCLVTSRALSRRSADRGVTLLTCCVRWGKESLGAVGPWSGLSSTGGISQFALRDKKHDKKHWEGSTGMHKCTEWSNPSIAEINHVETHCWKYVLMALGELELSNLR